MRTVCAVWLILGFSGSLLFFVHFGLYPDVTSPKGAEFPVVLEANSSTTIRCQENETALVPSCNSSENGQQKQVCPFITLCVPCTDRHFHHAKNLLASIKDQTVLPFQTLIVFSLQNETVKELDWDEFTAALPNLRVFLRVGVFHAGDNRKFLASHATTEYVSFYDCDDYMHMQRVEALSKMIIANPDIEALLTGYKFYVRESFSPAHFNSKHWLDFTKPSLFHMRWPFEQFWNSPPITKDWHGRQWNYSDPLSEPNRAAGSGHWWLPTNMTMSPPLRPMPHNGWLTIKRAVLDEVPYPDIPRGQDSLYNWRLLKSHRNFTYIPYRLGAYLMSRPKK